MAVSMQRYSKTDEAVGSSPFKTVYIGFDHNQGKSVAWSIVQMPSPSCAKELTESLLLAKRVEHDNILHIFDWFIDATDTSKMHIITELFRPGNLAAFLRQAGDINEMVLRKWGYDALCAISYVRSLNAPLLIPLCMGNVLIHQDVGTIKLDLLSVSSIFRSQGLARERMEEARVKSPETWLEEVDEKADTYSFGILLLEAATGMQAYAECRNFAALFEKVIHFRPPDALQHVGDPGLKDIIRRCLYPSAKRPGAHELLRLPYFCFEPTLFGMHVLVIDDDPVNLKVCSRLLEREGVTVVPCDSLKKVLELLSSRAFAGLITDIRMPDIDGFEMCKKLRERHFRSLVIIGVSAYTLQDVDVRLQESGMDAFLEKPFTFLSVQQAFRRARLSRTSSTQDA